ncbi:MAG: TonB family protein [Pyrinomonadaceae bacterium]
MLEQLIESKSNARENKTRGGFILTTFLLVMGLCFSAVLSSLFAMNLGIGGEDLELSALVMPIAPVDNKPEPVEPARKEENQTPKDAAETSRQTNTLRIEENPIVPNTISVVQNTQKARPNVPFEIKEGIEKDNFTSQSTINRESNGGGGEIGEKRESQIADNNEKEEEPVLKKTPVEPRKTILVSGGVVNGQATSLPKPVYPQTAKTVNASGEVSVQVMIDENGKVISAKAVSGHPLLRTVSEQAARSAKFKPTTLSNQPVKVTGVIIYNFAKN